MDPMRNDRLGRPDRQHDGDDRQDDQRFDQGKPAIAHHVPVRDQHPVAFVLGRLSPAWSTVIVPQRSLD